MVDLQPAIFVKKRYSGTGLSLRILQNSQDHRFCRTPLCDCFYVYQRNTNTEYRGIISGVFWKITVLKSSE